MEGLGIYWAVFRQHLCWQFCVLLPIPVGCLFGNAKPCDVTLRGSYGGLDGKHVASLGGTQVLVHPLASSNGKYIASLQSKSQVLEPFCKLQKQTLCLFISCRHIVALWKAHKWWSPLLTCSEHPLVPPRCQIYIAVAPSGFLEVTFDHLELQNITLEPSQIYQQIFWRHLISHANFVSPKRINESFAAPADLRKSHSTWTFAVSKCSGNDFPNGGFLRKESIDSMKRCLLVVFLERLQYRYCLLFTLINETFKRRCFFHEKSANLPSDDKVDKAHEKIILTWLAGGGQCQIRPHLMIWTFSINSSQFLDKTTIASPSSYPSKVCCNSHKFSRSLFEKTSRA